MTVRGAKGLGVRRSLLSATALVALAAAGSLHGTAVIGQAEAASGAGGNSGGGGTGGAAVGGTNGAPGNPGGADTVVNENGSSGGVTGGGGGSGGGAGGGNGGAGGGTANQSPNDPNTRGAGGTAAAPNGQDGNSASSGPASGDANTAGAGAGGGYGGANGNLPGAANLNNAGPLQGGNGGNGGIGGPAFTIAPNGNAYGGGGGGGGAGGYGAIITTGGSNTSTGTITGGNGGNGGAGGQAVDNATNGTAKAGNGGSGGDGGLGLLITGAGGTFTNSGTIRGGNGGTGGAGGTATADLGGTATAGNGGSGGLGGLGLLITGAGGTFTNSGTIRGGNGGTGGAGGTAILTAGGTATNGTAGASGLGGVAISGAELTIINSGTIAGGFANGGNGAQANAISFTGGTNRLELQAGYTISGNVVVQAGTGTLALGGANNASFDASQIGPTAQYRGFSAFDKTGSSTWTLTGTNNTLGQTWTVNGGILNVTGSLNTTAFAVNNGGTLAGSGTLGGLSVASGGIVHPGAVAGAPTTLNVAGNVTFATGSTFRVTLIPAASDQIRATGTATIQGGTVDVRAGAGTFVPTTYTLLTAQGGVTGTFTALQTTGNLAFLNPSLSYGPNTVSLTLTQSAPVQSAGTTTNQTSTGTAVQAAVPAAVSAATPTTATPAGTTAQAGTAQPAATQAATPAAQVATAVLNQTLPGAVQALNSLSGEIQASAISAELQTAFVVQEAILDHLRFGEGNGFAGPGLGGPGLTGAIGRRFAPGTTLPAMYAADLPGGPAIGVVPVRPVQPTYGVWGQAFGSFGSTGGDRNAARLTRQVGGFVLGAETGAGVLGGPFSEWRAGVAAGYSFTAFDVTARQSTGQVESGFGAVYARGPLGPLQIRLGAAYAGNALDTRRAVIFPGFSQSVTGKTGGDTVQGFGEVGYRIGFAAGYVEPFVGGAAIHIRRDGFAEVGGASALTVFGRSFDVQTATAGVQGQAVVADLFGGAGPLVARGLVGYRRAFGDVVPSALLAFGGGGQAFLTSGVPVARDALVASAGLDWQVGPRTTVGLSYNGQVGARAQDHAVKGSLSYRW